MSELLLNILDYEEQSKQNQLSQPSFIIDKIDRLDFY